MYKDSFWFLEHRLPSALEQIRRILAIPFKKTDSRLIAYLKQDELQALLDAPDPSSGAGIRDRAMLHLAFAAGLRASELVGLLVRDVTLQPIASILVRGKGRRERTLPLNKEASAALRAWLAVRPDVKVPEECVACRLCELLCPEFAIVVEEVTKTEASHES